MRHRIGSLEQSPRQRELSTTASQPLGLQTLACHRMVTADCPVRRQQVQNTLKERPGRKRSRGDRGLSPAGILTMSCCSPLPILSIFLSYKLKYGYSGNNVIW